MGNFERLVGKWEVNLKEEKVFKAAVRNFLFL